MLTVKNIKINNQQVTGIAKTDVQQSTIDLLRRIGFDKQSQNFVYGNTNFHGNINPAEILKSQIKERMERDRDALEDAADRLGCSKGLAFQYLSELSDIELLLRIDSATR